MADEQNEKNISQSIVEKLLKERAEAKLKQQWVVENIAEFKKALNGVCSTPNGKYFMRHLVAFSGIFEIDNEINPSKLIEEKGKRSVYLQLIRPHLEKAIRTEIES